MEDEIFYGLKNALERGSSLRDAVDSFVNAGYNPQEVYKAAEILSNGASQIVEKSELNNRPKPASVAMQPPRQLPPLPQRNLSGTEVRKESGGKAIIIVGIIIALILFLGALGYLVYVVLSQ